MELVAAEPLVRARSRRPSTRTGTCTSPRCATTPTSPAPASTPLGSRPPAAATPTATAASTRAHVFADGLLWPTGVACWKGGRVRRRHARHLVPQGHRRRPQGRRPPQGLHRLRHAATQQAMLNNLRVGPRPQDLRRRRPATAAAIRPADRPGRGGRSSVDGKDFRFDPVTEAFEPVTGTVQFGNTFDDWGNRFLCNSRSRCCTPSCRCTYLAAQPVPAGRPVRDAARSGTPGADVTGSARRSAWRQIRSSRRIAPQRRAPPTAAGASHHVVDAAAGVTVYRGGAYPAEVPRQRLRRRRRRTTSIHRRLLDARRASTFAPSGPTRGREFVALDRQLVPPGELRQRPRRHAVRARHVPRGDRAIQVIPNDVVKHLDLHSGRDRGRIYRLAPPGFTPTAAAAARQGDDGRAGRRARPPERLVARHGPPAALRAAGHGGRRAAAAARPRDGRAARPAARRCWSLEGLKRSTTATLHSARCRRRPASASTPCGWPSGGSNDVAGPARDGRSPGRRPRGRASGSSVRSPSARGSPGAVTAPEDRLAGHR